MCDMIQKIIVVFSAASAFYSKNILIFVGKMPQGERFVELNQIAIQQMQVLEDNEGRKLLK